MPSVTLLKPAALTAINAQIADIYEQLAAFTEFDPDLYSTTTQINDMLAAYVPKTRTIAAGGGVTINGAGSATLTGTVTVALAFASQADAEGGTATDKPMNALRTKQAIDEFSKSWDIGCVGYYAGPTPPDGCLVRNGAAISRTTYAALFAVIGTTYGAGDNSTTFNLPDDRGYFDRGWDNGRGIDVGRTFGSYQADEVKSHTHLVPAGGVGGGAGTASYGSSYDGTIVTNGSGGAETRPKNRAYLPIIKAF